MNFYYGVVENRFDPLLLGRCQVRIAGLHTHDKNLLPTGDLPWATPLQPVISAAMNGIGHTPVGPVEGTAVIIIFADQEQQQPIMIGTIGGIPAVPTTPEAEDSGAVNVTVGEYRMVAGGVDGKTITLFDKDNLNNLDITKDLKADMPLEGFNIPPGTTIVSIDGPNKITLSNPVTSLDENILSFKEPPTNLAAVAQSKLNAQQNLPTDKGGNPITPEKAEKGVQPAEEVKSSATNDSIPTIPPPKSSNNESKSSAGIKALIAAADKVGLTTKEQKCALLGICGGESQWIPQEEGYNYGRENLKKTFRFVTDADAEKYSNAKKKGMSRKEFFDFIYHPKNNGKNVGNTQPDDGGKFYGRGFIQLTGRWNYEKYTKLAKANGEDIDLVNDPDILVNDLDKSAYIAALFIKNATPKSVRPNDNNGYFIAARSATGHNAGDGYEKKRTYYEYFYGQPDATGIGKDAGPPPAEPPKDEDPKAAVVPQPSVQSQSTGSTTIGFRDPNNKYPLRSHINEPDTNRLARGDEDRTIVRYKDKLRKTSVPKAMESENGSWEQPLSAYSAQYPFNKVYESESGHIQEFDDTPGYERIHTYHRSGTFTEVNPDGTQVNYIHGDSFTIVERNGCINIEGECNITVVGSANVLVQNNANVEVFGNTQLDLRRNALVRVGKQLDVIVNEDINIKAGGDLNIEAANINVKSNGDINLESADLNINSKGDTNFLTGTSLRLTSTFMDLSAGSLLNVDYARGEFGNGAATASSKTIDAIDLTAVELGSPSLKRVPYGGQIERKAENQTVAETPEQAGTPEGRRATHELSQKEGVPNPPPLPIPDESNEAVGQNAPPAPPPTTGATGAPSPTGEKTAVSVDCSIINSTKDFTRDYRLSKNITLGMLICDNKHILTSQQLTNNVTGKPHVYTPQEIVCNLANLAQTCLEPIMGILPEQIGGYGRLWTFTSGYRLRGVCGNESPNSDHCKGHCADIQLIKAGNKAQAHYELVNKIQGLVPFDQLILEYRAPTSIWIHIGYHTDRNRNMAFTMVNDRTYKRDSGGNPSGFYLLDGPIPPKG